MSKLFENQIASVRGGGGTNLEEMVRPYREVGHRVLPLDGGYCVFKKPAEISEATQTVIDALDALALAAEDDDEFATHCGSLIKGKPDKGSFVDGLDSFELTRIFLTGLSYTEVKWDSLPEGCGIEAARYFKASCVGHPAFQNFLTFSDANSREGMEVEVRSGIKPSPQTGNPEGLRLFAEGNAAEPATELWVIIGAHKDEEAVPWTWHPGPPAPPIADHRVPAIERFRDGEATDEDLETLAPCAVHLTV